MPADAWFVHIQSETFGPVPTSVLTTMLRQGRLQLSDFAWTEGLTKWIRLGELPQFAPLLPPYPSVPIPATTNVLPPEQTAPAAQAAPSPSPSPAPKPAAPPAAAAASSPPVPKPTGVESPLKAWIRRYSRADFQGKVTVEGHGTYDAVDISEGGVFIRTDAPIPFGTDLRFKLEGAVLPKPLDMTGIVIREGANETGHVGFAIQFTRVNPAHRRVIHEYVKSQNPSME